MKTVTAQRGVIAPYETLPGLIAPHQNVGLSSSLAEPAVAVNVREGDAVHKGEVIAVLATDDLEASLQSALQTAAEYRAKTTQTVYTGRLAIGQGSDQVRVARAALAQAKATLAQAQQLLGREEQVSGSYLPVSTVDQQRTLVATDAQAVRSAQASLTSALQNVAVNGGSDSGLQAANVAGARAAAESAAAQATLLERDIARATIRSPIDGYVINRNLNPGEYPSGRQIFTLQETSHVYAVLSASSNQVFRVHVGASASITRSGAGRGSFPGTVSAVLGEATPGSTNFSVEVDVPNDHGVLISGMPVTGRIALPRVGGIEIPQTAFLDAVRRSRSTSANKRRTEKMRSSMV
ncbi:MAG: efflux RND transporter periplasmic adaptor subunit [Candidatus Eremiobacteraeota bacterium]|nr:efflux RND transporter periplasmic adaptor subunit [Candidatus Eremiobacteraeota bacterium]MBC5803270.1 efflux RND transporter periplasmic adaptor subunit [Candidatus Eremiobacteraeota bacterium]